MLERKYGGLRARRAATTIQRAWRAYLMQRRFRDITQQVTQANKDGLLMSGSSLTGSARRLARRAVPSILSDGGLHHQHFYHHNYFSGNYTANNPYYQQWAYSSQHHQLPPLGQPATHNASSLTATAVAVQNALGPQQAALNQTNGSVNEVMLNPVGFFESIRTFTFQPIIRSIPVDRNHSPERLTVHLLSRQ